MKKFIVVSLFSLVFCSVALAGPPNPTGNWGKPNRVNYSYITSKGYKYKIACEGWYYKWGWILRCGPVSRVKVAANGSSSKLGA